MADRTATKTISTNKKAFHDYFVEESLEAGIELVGTEVKSLRQGAVNLKDAWCSIVDGELYVNGMHISPYEHGNIFNRDPMRVRRLLVHKKETLRLFGLMMGETASVPVQHGKIVDALESGNSEALEQALREHLQQYKALVQEARKIHPDYFMEG